MFVDAKAKETILHGENSRFDWKFIKFQTLFNGVYFSGGAEEKVANLSRLVSRRSVPGPVITIRTHRGRGDTVPMIKNLILAANTTNTSLPEKIGAKVLTIRVYSTVYIISQVIKNIFVISK